MAAGVLAAGSAYFAPLTSLQCLRSCIEVACQQNTFQAAHLCSPPHGCASRHAAANSAFFGLDAYLFMYFYLVFLLLKICHA